MRGRLRGRSREQGECQIGWQVDCIYHRGIIFPKTLSASTLCSLSLFFVRGAILCNSQGVSGTIMSQGFHPALGSLKQGGRVLSQEIDISLHFHMLLTAPGWPAGQRQLNTASLIQMPALLCTPRGRCFTPFPTLINFLTRHPSSFPTVMSSTLCPVALLLSNGRMFDIKIVLLWC